MKREEVSALIKSIGILPSVRVCADLALFAAETVYSQEFQSSEITLTVLGAAGCHNLRSVFRT